MPTRVPPRSAPDYDWDNDGGSSRQGAGIYILKPDVNAQVKKPSWHGTETIFRPYPCRSFTDPDNAFEPYRLIVDGDRCKFSDWIRRYACAWMVGNPAITYLIKKPNRLYDPWNSPLGILYRAIENACKKGHPNTAEWQPLRESSGNRGRSLRGPSELYLIQGALLKHDKTEFVGKNGPPLGWGKNPTCILMMSKDAGAQLVDLLNKEKQDYNGPPTDFENRYENGDPVSPLFGRFFHFWEKGSNARGGRYNSQPTQAMASAFEDVGDGMADRGGAGGFTPKGFEVEVAKAIGTRPASFNAQGEEQIRQHWQHWDDILCFPTEVEQAHLLFTCFPASACIYAFEGHNKEWIPPDAYKMLNKAVSASVPGAVPGAKGFPEAPPPDMDGWGADPVGTPAAPPSTAVAMPAPAAPAATKPQQPVHNGPAANEDWDASGEAVADSTVPVGAIPDDPVTPPASSSPEPTPATPVAVGAANTRTADAIARLAKTRSQMQ